MKKVNIILMVACISVFGCNQKKTDKADLIIKNGINWHGKNEAANDLADRGRLYFMNVEFEKAFTVFEEAVNIDSSLFASHTVLAFMTRGEVKEHHKSMAKKFVVNENETSKLFVTLADIENDSTGELSAPIWAKMHALSNGTFIHHFYAATRSDTTEAISELEKLIAFDNENGFDPAPEHNLLGYLYYASGEKEKGVAEIERYMNLYPSGYNPLDSRAEFYLRAGDTSNAIVYYKKVLDRFPFSNSARNQVRILEKKK